MHLKDKIVQLIIEFVMNHGHTTGEKLEKELAIFETNLRKDVKWYLTRDEYKKEVEETIKQVDKNLESSLKSIPLDDPSFLKKLHNILRRAQNFAHLYVSLSR